MLITILKVVGILFLILLAASGVMAAWAFNYHKKLKAEPLNNVDLSKVKDGEYDGRWEVKMWTAPVHVVVKNHKITDIKITREQYKMPDSENELLKRIIEKQSLDVDAIAGATITTKSILKSVEDALQQGIS